MGPTSSRREFLKTVACTDLTTIVPGNTENIVFVGDVISTTPFLHIWSEREPLKSTKKYPEWLIDLSPVKYPPNRAERRAMRKGKKGKT